MTIQNLSPAKITPVDSTIFDYGRIKKGENTTVQLLISKETPIEFVKKSHCGCFTVNPTNEEGKVKLTLSYNSNLLGQFDKFINVFVKGDSEEKVQIKIKGIVK